MLCTTQLLVLQEIAQALKRTENKLLFACLELEVAGKRADLLASQKDPQLQDAVTAAQLEARVAS